MRLKLRRVRICNKSSYIKDSFAEVPTMDALLFTYICGCTLCDLQKVPFNCRDVAGQQDIIRTGRPTPNLEELTTVSAKKGFTRHFHPRLYVEHPWLAGCPIQNKLFCWPCSLFLNKSCPRRWTHDGHNNLNNLQNAIARHQKCKPHIGANLSLREFGQTRQTLTQNGIRRNDAKRHNARADENRKILERFVDVVCHLAIQSRGNSETEVRGNFNALVNLLAKYDPVLAKHVEDPTSFQSISSTLYSDMVESISVVVTNAIWQEVKAAPFVSVVLFETPDINQTPQLSTVLRYLTRGEMVERFFNFKELGETWTAEMLSSHLLEVVTTHELDQKVVSQTYDCSWVSAAELREAQAGVKLVCHGAIPVHYTTHHLNLVLTESVKAVSGCGVFFMTLAGLATFFTRSSRRVALLERMVKRRLQHADQSAWDFYGRLVHTVKENRADMIELFAGILENVDGWDDEAICCAQGFVASLRSFATAFLLNVFADLFDETTGLFDALHAAKHDLASSCQAQLDHLRLALLAKRQSFDHYYEATEKTAGKSAVFDGRPPDSKTIDQMRVTYLEIIDNISANLSVRFDHLDHLQFLRLLDSGKFADFAEQFPTQALDNLLATYPAHFDGSALRSELTVLYNRESYRGLTGVRELYDYISGVDLGEAIPETFNLCKLMLTLQASTTDEGSKSALERIKSFTANATERERKSGLALLSIERDLLARLRVDNAAFHKLVIDEFAKRGSAIELMYRGSRSGTRGQMVEKCMYM